MPEPDVKVSDPLDSDPEITQEEVSGLMEYMEKHMSRIHSHDLSRLFSFILFHYQINSVEAMEILMNATRIHMYYSEAEDEDEVTIDEHDCSRQEEDTVH